MKISAKGVLRNAIMELPPSATGEKWSLNQLGEHLQELGERYYAGDIKVVDEFLTLYCLDKTRPRIEPKIDTLPLDLGDKNP